MMFRMLFVWICSENDRPWTLRSFPETSMSEECISRGKDIGASGSFDRGYNLLPSSISLLNQELLVEYGHETKE